MGARLVVGRSGEHVIDRVEPPLDATQVDARFLAVCPDLRAELIARDRR